MAREHWLEPPAWWKKVKPLRWAAVGGLVFVLVSAFYTTKVLIAPSEHAETERFLEVAPDPVVLLSGFRSYDTVESVKARLDELQVASTTNSLRPPASRKYPPRDRDTLQAPSYKHLGIEGQLTLEFFNDRLYEATFVPMEPAEYAEKLHRADQRLKRERSGRVEQITGHLRVASNVDFTTTDVGRSLQTKPYVIWQDLRLVEQLDEWDRRFVVAPQRN
jgi:hypothetical protein